MGRKRKWNADKLSNKFLEMGKNIQVLSKTEDGCYLTNDYIECKCRVCGHVWNSKLNTIFRTKNGCRNCSHRYTNQKFDDRITGRDIKRIDDYVQCDIHIRFQCLKCDYIWKAVPNSITSAGSGCPKCVDRVKLTNEDIDLKLKNNDIPIKRIGEYITTDTPILFQCLIESCNHIWKASPANIFLRGRRCPLHFRKNEKICVDTLKKYFNLIHNFHLYKIDKNISKHCSVDIFIEINGNSKFKGIAIEYQGKQHYAPNTWGKIPKEAAELNFKKQVKSDKIKRKFCKLHKIKLIEIDGRKFYNDKLKNYLQEFIIPEINRIISDK